MFIAYVDDSGDETSFALGALLVDVDAWPDVHRALVDFRRRLSSEHGYRMRREIKASQLVGGSGNWRKPRVPTRTRHGIYLAALREIGSLYQDVRALAVVVPNRRFNPEVNPVELAWELILERLERQSTKKGEKCILMPDDGNPVMVRKIARRMRRFSYAPSAFGGPGLARPFTGLIEDPAHIDSSHSCFMQWADLVAHAAFREISPRPGLPPLWHALGEARHEAANAIERRKGADEPPGLIVFPRRRL